MGGVQEARVGGEVREIGENYKAFTISCQKSTKRWEPTATTTTTCNNNK